MAVMRARASARASAIALTIVTFVGVAATARAEMFNPFQRPKTKGKVSEHEIIAEAPTDDHVLKLDASIFDNELKKSKYNFVMFYAPWDGHSKAFMPRWMSYAQSH